jgi:hypothetical protein
MQKSSAGAPAKPAPERPRTIVAMVVLLVATGLAAVGAAIALFGAKDYLFNTALKNHLVLTTTEWHAQQNGLRSHLNRDLTAHPQLGDAAVAARANSVQQFVTKSLRQVKHYNESDASSQATKMHDATSSALGGVSGPRLSTSEIHTQVSSLTTTYANNLEPLTYPKIRSSVNSAPKQALIINMVLLVALIFVAASAWRGRYWSRWAVMGLWVLSTLGGTFAGISSIFYATVSAPGTFKTPLVLAGLCFVAALVTAWLPASSRYYAALRPAGQPQRRGLFGPRVPPTARDKTAPTRTATRAPATESDAATASPQAGADRAKAKQRASAEAVAKGADLARSRAKAASKSRRSGS